MAQVSTTWSDFLSSYFFTSIVDTTAASLKKIPGVPTVVLGVSLKALEEAGSCLFGMWFRPSVTVPESKAVDPG